MFVRKDAHSSHPGQPSQAGPRQSGRTDGWGGTTGETDGRTDGRDGTDGRRTDRQTDERTERTGRIVKRIPNPLSLFKAML